VHAASQKNNAPRKKYPFIFYKSEATLFYAFRIHLKKQQSFSYSAEVEQYASV
jgi:hypothetical protein